MQWAWLLSSYFGLRAMANFSVYVPSGLCVQANEGVDKACVGCGESFRTCEITFEMTFILKTRWLRAVKYLAARITGAVTTALCVHTWQQQKPALPPALATLPFPCASLKCRGYNRVSATFCSHVAQCACMISFWDPFIEFFLNCPRSSS